MKARVAHSTSGAPAPARNEPSPLQKWLCVAILVLAVLAAYYNSFSGPFIFDDLESIPRNPSIRDLSEMSDVLSPPPGGLTVSGRPLLNLSFAINYALGETSVRGYHIFNLVIHLLASLTLFGIVRRTLLQRALSSRFAAASLPLAAGIALLWAAHPLQTQSVTYIVQRAESLMGLFYLLTIYCFIRATDSRARIWPVLAVVACLCGMATKEVMVTAPVMALLYDRTFVAGTFREALRRRWKLYLGLGCTWLLLGWLAITGGQMGSEPGVPRLAPWQNYGLTQFWAIVHYLRLSIWPHPLVLDYGSPGVNDLGIVILPCAIAVIALLAATLFSLWRRLPVGFAGAWFFGILALTSSVVPLDDTVFEHRMYLPLAAVITVMVLTVHAYARKWTAFAIVGASLALVVVTAQRNADYRSDIAIWSATVADCPTSSRAHCSLGLALRRAGELDQAIHHYQIALKLKPNYADAHKNLGAALMQLERFREAEHHFRQAIQANPRDAGAYNNLGGALYYQGRLDEAIAQFRESLRVRPNDPRTLSNLAAMLEEKEAAQQTPAPAP